MPTGNGAYVLHKMIEAEINNYRVHGYNPYLTLTPPLLTFIGRSKKPPAVHSTPDYAIFFYRKNIPLVLTFHNYVLDHWMRSYSSPLQKIHYRTDLRLWSGMAVRRAHRITAVSHFTAGLAQKDLNIHHPIKIIYNGIDTARFIPARSNASRKELRVFFSGNLTRRKGAHWLHAIGKRLKKDVTLYYTQGLRTRKPLQAARGLKAVGPIPFERMAERYREMDILLLPTVREGLSLSVLEAMACGLPVIASNCSSLPEQIDHGKGGFLCPIGDVDAFAEKINLLADSPRLRREMGEYNRAKVEKMFTLERMVNEYKDLFEEVLE
jgi:glycosyltransferase involved in cell wall biosynthesis